MCIHAEAPYRTGRAYSEQDVTTLLGWVKELGGNFARLAHYPHDERMERAADRMGVLLWSEVPVYWAVEFDKDYVFEKAKQQMHENIRRDRDKASVIPVVDCQRDSIDRCAHGVSDEVGGVCEGTGTRPGW